MGRFDFIRKKKFYKHLSFILLSTVAIAWIVLQALNVYTQQGKTYIVGDYMGLTLEEINNDPQNNTFEFVIVDSIFDNLAKKQSVVTQSPTQNSVVKKGRKIYLTIVASQPEIVQCPNLEDLTVRQANTMLETYGLKIGRIEYVPDIGNTVVCWKHKGKPLKPYEKIQKGSRVDLVVGNEDGTLNTIVPNIVGKTQQEAHSILLAAGLNIGKEINCKQSPNCKVARQQPAHNEDEGVSLGTSIDIWYE
jgi:beta-lactam-binding protein with PASTA domain